MRKAYVDISAVLLTREDFFSMFAAAGLEIVGSAETPRLGEVRFMIQGDALPEQCEVKEGLIPPVVRLWCRSEEKDGCKTAHIERFEMTSLLPLRICDCSPLASV